MIAAREVSVVEAVTAFLDRIQQANGAVGAIVSLRERDDVLAEAATLDGRLADGETPGPLFGLPIAVKDLALTKGVRTTFGSRIFADFVPDRDEFFVERMRKAGAIIIGKTNVPEFGFGSQSYNAVFGTTRNAHDPRLTAGGSSGGAASALALHMLPIADGSDFCGSLRNPAGWHHIFSLRPSPGRVAAGPAPELFLSQMGVVGPMGRSVSDVALLMSAMATIRARRCRWPATSPGRRKAGLAAAYGASPGSAISAATCPPSKACSTSAKRPWRVPAKARFASSLSLSTSTTRRYGAASSRCATRRAARL